MGTISFQRIREITSKSSMKNAIVLFLALAAVQARSFHDFDSAEWSPENRVRRSAEPFIRHPIATAAVVGTAGAIGYAAGHRNSHHGHHHGHHHHHGHGHHHGHHHHYGK